MPSEMQSAQHQMVPSDPRAHRAQQSSKTTPSNQPHDAPLQVSPSPRPTRLKRKLAGAGLGPSHAGASNVVTEHRNDFPKVPGLQVHSGDEIDRSRTQSLKRQKLEGSDHADAQHIQWQPLPPAGRRAQSPSEHRTVSQTQRPEQPQHTSKRARQQTKDSVMHAPSGKSVLHSLQLLQGQQPPPQPRTSTTSSSEALGGLPRNVDRDRGRHKHAAPSRNNLPARSQLAINRHAVLLSPESSDAGQSKHTHETRGPHDNALEAVTSTHRQAQEGLGQDVHKAGEPRTSRHELPTVHSQSLQIDAHEPPTGRPQGMQTDAHERSMVHSKDLQTSAQDLRTGHSKDRQTHEQEVRPEHSMGNRRASQGTGVGPSKGTQTSEQGRSQPGSADHHGIDTIPSQDQTPEHGAGPPRAPPAGHDRSGLKTRQRLREAAQTEEARLLPAEAHPIVRNPTLKMHHFRQKRVSKPPADAPSAGRRQAEVDSHSSQSGRGGRRRGRKRQPSVSSRAPVPPRPRREPLTPFSISRQLTRSGLYEQGKRTPRTGLVQWPHSPKWLAQVRGRLHHPSIPSSGHPSTRQRGGASTTQHPQGPGGALTLERPGVGTSFHEAQTLAQAQSRMKELEDHHYHRGYQKSQGEAQQMFNTLVQVALARETVQHQTGILKGTVEGHQSGLREGRAEGHEQAKQAGHESGLREGHESGLREGHESGLREGHESGLREGHESGSREGHENGLREGHEGGLREGHATGVWKGYRLGKHHELGIVRGGGHTHGDYHHGYHLGADHVHERQDHGAAGQNNRPYGLGYRHGVQHAGVPDDKLYELGERHAAERLAKLGAMERGKNPHYALGYGHSRAVTTHPANDRQAFSEGYLFGDLHARQRHEAGFPRLAPPDALPSPVHGSPAPSSPAHTGAEPETESPGHREDRPAEHGAHPPEHHRSRQSDAPQKQH